MIVARDLARQDPRKARNRRRYAGPFQGSSDLLRRTCKDFRRLRLGIVRPDDGRADGGSFVDQFQSFGGSMVMLAKGNRSSAVREACKRHGGFYLGSIGGAAARLARTASGKSRGSGVSGTRDGSDLADRSREFPGLYRDRRQGE